MIPLTRFRFPMPAVRAMAVALSVATAVTGAGRAVAQTDVPAAPSTNQPEIGGPAVTTPITAEDITNLAPEVISPGDPTNVVQAAMAQFGDETNNVKSLTLEECIARGLANNFDVRIQRINPSIQNWGVVLAQGAYDPTLSGSYEYNDSLLPNPGGQPPVRDITVPSQLNLGGKFVSGATYGLTASDTRFKSGSEIGTNFTYTGSAALTVTQPLLKNFGFDVNTATIRVARKSRDIAVQNFLLQMINSISAVDNAYYELVFAIEDYKSKREDLDLAQQLLDEDRKRLQIGTMSPLDVVQAEAGVAERKQAIILAAGTIHDNANALKLLISQNVQEFRGVLLVPTEYPVVVPFETDLDHSINTALQTRPDYLAAIQSVEQQNIVVKFNHNQLWPELDVNGSYGYNGGGDNFGDWVGSVASRNYPVWAAGVSVSFPLGNRQARATYNSARLQAEQLLLKLKQLEQQIIVNVDNAVAGILTNLENVKATRAATRAADESYKAEKTKLLTGTSTTFLVLQAESQLADARSAQIRAEANYSESLVTLAQSEGTTLQRHHIQLNENF